jgi:hypothetical protein
MVDTANPTDQFHPYQKPDVVPHKDRELSGVRRLMERARTRVGYDGTSVRRARTWARHHPGQLLGGLAALVIGAGLMSRRNK